MNNKFIAKILFSWLISAVFPLSIPLLTFAGLSLFMALLVVFSTVSESPRAKSAITMASSSPNCGDHDIASAKTNS